MPRLWKIPECRMDLSALLFVLSFFMSAFAPGFSGAAEDSSLQLSGSLKTYFFNIGSTTWMGDTSGWTWDTPLRARLFYKPGDTFSFEAEEELTSRYQSGASLVVSYLGSARPSSYRIWDMNRYWAGSNSGDGAKLLQNLDRFSSTVHLGKLDITSGRQAISFGSARAVNPTDLFTTFQIENPDRENRSGVDALRARYAWSDLGELDAGYVAGKDARWDQSAVFVRPRLHLWGVDVTPLGMIYRKNRLAGLDLQGSIGGAGAWIEGALVHPGCSEKTYPRVSAGFDYNFGLKIYAFLEYHYNGAGELNPADYPHPSHLTAYEDGTIYLLGRNYLIPSLTYQVSTLISLQSKLLINISDQSILAMMQWEHNIAKNFYLDIGAAVPMGSGLKGRVPTSEYGLYPSFQYIYMRNYF